MTTDEPIRRKVPLNPDPDHLYTEAELDAIEEIDPALALRIDRAQTLAARQRVVDGLPAGGSVDPAQVAAVLEEARRILQHDGGDIELVAVEGSAVRVRMKGACAGCPRSVLDLHNVVERLVKERVPGVSAVTNVF